MIVVDSLTVRFGGVHALQDISLEFGEGITGLIGPNGAGKTTLLNVLSGFVRPYSGTLTSSDGEDLLAMAPHERARWGLRRGFQHDQIVPGLTARQQLQVVAENSGHGDSGMATERALAFLGLLTVAERPATQLDPRQRRLLELGRTIVSDDARAILLDEPGAGLNEQEKDELTTMISSLPERLGAGVILVDHDMELVRKCCTNIAVLDFGRLLTFGPTNEVLSDPAVQAAYLGSTAVPMQEDAAL